MNFDWADWGPPLAVLGAAVVGAGAIVASSRAGADEARMREAARREDLSKDRDATIQALKDLELEQGKLSAADYQRERQSLLARGAAAMRSLDGLAVAPAGPAAAAPAPALAPELVAALANERARLGAAFPDALAAVVPDVRPPRGTISPEWRGALVTLGLFGVLGALYSFAGSGAVERGGGGSMTGNQTLGAPAATSPEEPALLAAVAKDPADVASWNRLTTLALSERNLAAALERNQQALTAAPQDTEALTYRAVLTAMIGRPEVAIEQLEKVLATNPTFTTALVYHGLIAAQAGQTEKAITSLERAIAAGAPNPEYLREELARVKGGGAAAPPDAPAGAAAPAGPAVVTGTITLAEGVVADGSQVLFVSARSPAGGPPLLAKRLPPGPFPMTFALTEADRPMSGGGPLPASFDLTVRLDRDGNAMTKGDDEPTAKLPGVTPGSTDLSVVLH